MDWLIPFLPAFLAAYSIQIVGVMSPGPAVALLLGIGAEQGRASALMAAFGIACGAGVLALATSLGLGLIMQEIAWAGTALRLLGAGYLAWLAYKAMKKALSPPQVHVAEVRRQPMLRLFLTGLGLQITNIKALVFWMAAASVGPAQNAPLPVLLVFALGGTVLSLAGHGFWAVVLSSRPVRHAYNRARRWIEGALGIFLGAMALRMAMERR
ncbi:LysE family translocator [Paracoccus laeviglucosivorans]|uniref:Threonine/homoserine/homoserine lactone efflux protein n=1 Tax=Paracoccus laeviglucosivorans TaxID=1197861 RepID=A0A521ASR7_9RHOB|nr:LysE family translocator [Paracoccus laeviglucosivorans]SMO37873.1 Threonine/homoserine/homoserine lactone efflux protein [Paracoccus laeviglucosivorans]